MNVLVVSSKYPPEYSGSGLRAHTTYKRLSKKFDFRFDVLCGSVTYNHSQSYQYEGVNVSRIARNIVGGGIPAEDPQGDVQSRSRPLARRALGRLSYLLEAFATVRRLRGAADRYDAFHIFGNTNVTSAAVSYAKMFHIPFLLEFTSDRSSPHAYEPKLIRWLWGTRLPDFSRIVCISERLRDMCRQHGYVNNVWCRPNPVDETRFFPEPELRAKYRRRHTEFGDDDVVLCYVAKFMPTKNQLFLIEVMRRLPEAFKLLLAGPVVTEGPLHQRDARYFERISSAIERNALQRRVTVVPSFIDQPEEYMKLSDVYAFPSTNEGLGTPMLEAIACGIPVVANRMEGITDVWVEDGKSGFVAELDPAEFADKVVSAARIPGETLLRKSREVLDAASTQTIDQQYCDILYEITQHRPRRRDKSARERARTV